MELPSALAPFTPFAQTLAWIILIMGLAAWLRQPIRSILEAIERRVEAGSAIKAEWLEKSQAKAKIRQALANQGPTVDLGVYSRSQLQAQFAPGDV